jgi:hypothetical protein
VLLIRENSNRDAAQSMMKGIGLLMPDDFPRPSQFHFAVPLLDTQHNSLAEDYQTFMMQQQ